MARILVIEDDHDLATRIGEGLTFEKHSVDLTNTGADAQIKLTSRTYDLIILDILLPDISGLDLLRAFRQAGGTAPVLVLSAKATIQDKEAGFEAGADDYLTKPFHIRELWMRANALLKRSSVLVDDVLRAADLVLDTRTRSATRAGRPIQLARKEFDLLEFFMRHPNQVFSPEALLDHLWPADSETSPEVIRTFMKKLRKKIDREGEPSLIRNLHGVGYKLEQPPDCDGGAKR